MYPVSARRCQEMMSNWTASAGGIDWGKWPYRWALKFLCWQRSPREYSWKRWGLRAKRWNIKGSQHCESTEEEENSASLMFLESKRRRSSEKDVITCVRCCQEVRLRWDSVSAANFGGMTVAGELTKMVLGEGWGWWLINSDWGAWILCGRGGSTWWVQHTFL